MDSEPRHKEAEGHSSLFTTPHPHCDLASCRPCTAKEIPKGNFHRTCTHIAAGMHCDGPAIGVQAKCLNDLHRISPNTNSTILPTCGFVTIWGGVACE